MSLAYLTPKGQVIKAKGVDRFSHSNENYEMTNIRFDSDGSLVEFTIGIPASIDNTYIFVDKSHYYSASQKKEGKTGYLKLRHFIELKNSPNTIFRKINTRQNIDSMWFDSHLEFATDGDIFNIEKVLVNEDTISTYYTSLKQSFKLNKNYNIDYQDASTYPQSIILDENSLNYNKIEKPHINRLGFEEGNFFKKNFDPILNSTTIQFASKVVLYRKLIQICFAIYWIRKEVLDTIAVKPISEIETAVKNNTIDSQTGQEYNYPLIDRVIGKLLLDWGYKSLADTKLLVPQPDNDYFYEGYYTVFENLEIALANFHHNLREKIESGLFPGNSDSSNDFQSYNRIKVLMKILPTSAMSILPYNFREDIIDDYIKGYVNNSIKIDYGDPRIPTLNKQDPFTNNDQEQCLSIINSFYFVKDDREKFLIYLLNIRDGKDSNFKILMNMFSAARIMRIAPPIGFFLRQKNYRINYIYAIYKIWQKSKYNFFYYPNLNDSIDNSVVNASSYFFTQEGAQYFQMDDKKVTNYTVYFGVTWKSVETTDFYDVVLSSYTKRLYSKIEQEGKLVKAEFNDYLYENKTKPGEDTETVSTAQYTHNKKLEFHLYQPISLKGYQMDPELKPAFPNLHQIPAFIWYYSQDYKDIKEFDAGYNLVLGVAFDVGLFFITGGLGVVSSFRHLRYLTLIGRSFRATQGAGAIYTAFVLEGLGVGAEAVTISSMVCTRYYDFMVATAPTEDLAKHYEDLNKMFFWITLLAAGASLSFRALAVKQARLVNSAPYFSNLPVEIRDAVSTISGTLSSAVTKFRDTRINNLQEVTTKFDPWSDIKKTAFFEDFGNFTDDALIEINNVDVVSNWEKLHLENIVERKNLAIIKSNNRTDDLKFFYESIDFKKSMSKKTSSVKITFLDEFRNATTVQKNEFKNNFQLANYWERYRFESNITNKFKNLSFDNKIEILKKFGNVEEKLFDGFRKNPDKIAEYLSKSTNGKVLLEDYMYFWLTHNVDYKRIERLAEYFVHPEKGIVGKINKNNKILLFTDPLKKAKAIDYLNSGQNWSLGAVIEVLAEPHLSKMINSNTDVFLGVDIRFMKANNNPVNKRMVQELDFVVYSNSSNKIDILGSIKPDFNKHKMKIDLKKLFEYIKPIPDSGTELHSFITDVLKIKTYIDNPAALAEIQSAKIVYTDLKTNTEVLVTPSIFRQKLPANASLLNGIMKVHPDVFGSTKSEIVESAYQTLIKKF
ncbi:hypothetical protein [uncultured Chryseobacterium sp.]|uniref:hypothetical protein n=1 Tax=uncultured Chryseobacterium sp. TaxID=259322 RepID=UPI0025D41AAE|nr:hypothetical protein [uncultured Chryseobacterium sp.]